MNELDLTYFFFKLPLYKPIKITEDNWDDFLTLLNVGVGQSETSIEGYNPFHRTESTFGGWSNINEGIGHFTSYGGTDRIRIKCKRYGDIFNFFIHFNSNEHILMKVGQYPSIADFHIYELKRYNKVLTKEELREFSKGIGLAANGVGIGSFVYLRRIFESLIWKTFNEHKSTLKISDNDFSLMKMDNKISALNDYLPSFLITNKSLYSIMSLGIHKLLEEECLAYFDTIRIGIELILDEKLEELKRKEKINAAQKQISELHGKLKK